MSPQPCKRFKKRGENLIQIVCDRCFCALAPRRVGRHVFPIVKRHVERVVLVSDDAIAQAQRSLWATLRVVAEPGGAAAFAALLSGRYQPSPGERVGVILSGGNTVAVNFDR